LAISLPKSSILTVQGLFVTPSLGLLTLVLLQKKTAILNNYIHSEALDVFVITEMWHENVESVALRRIARPDFDYIEAARPIME